jgi:hypothetical protein
MQISGLHILLTYQCTLECEHCFVWGSPRQSGVMTLAQIRTLLKQAQDLGTVTSVYFEGGEPFLYYATLLQAVREAAGMGFAVGIVSNGFWATSAEDALAALRPFAGLVQDLSVSTDLFHWEAALSRQARAIAAAAAELGIPLGMISVAQPETCTAPASAGQIPGGESQVMYRGRAAEVLAGRAAGTAWEQFNTCPHEDLREPGRVHVDPLGNIHLCQGILLGNAFMTPLKEILASFDPDAHPIAGPLLKGGPAELVRHYALPHAEKYADACHLCYTARKDLRPRFPELLAPDQVYGMA